MSGVESKHGSVQAGTVGPDCHHGIKNIAFDDWNSIVCPRCGRDWQGQSDYLADLARSAPGGEVTLGQYAPPQIARRSW